jgi:hypothetical protein
LFHGNNLFIFCCQDDMSRLDEYNDVGDQLVWNMIRFAFTSLCVFVKLCFDPNFVVLPSHSFIHLISSCMNFMWKTFCRNACQMKGKWSKLPVTSSKLAGHYEKQGVLSNSYTDHNMPSQGLDERTAVDIFVVFSQPIGDQLRCVI